MLKNDKKEIKKYLHTLNLSIIKFYFYDIFVKELQYCKSIHATPWFIDPKSHCLNGGPLGKLFKKEANINFKYSTRVL